MSPVVLAPHTEVSRPLSALEYFHACVGAHPTSLLPPREVVVVVDGAGRLPRERWQGALDRVVAANPGCRLRIVGERMAMRFESDGAPTRLRVVPDSGWDGLSQVGAEVLTDTPLPFASGPLSELIVLESPDGATTRLALRAHHAAMDGQGVMHVFHELFRALRDEPLVGSNANFSDTELMLSSGVKKSDSIMRRAAQLLGKPAGDDPGNVWRRVSIPGRRANSMHRLVIAFAEFARRHDSKLPCVFSIPVNGRRHLDGMRTTQNFTNMLLVPLYPGEGVEAFKQRLKTMLDAKMETAYFRVVEQVKRVPRAWIDRLASPHAGNFRRRRLHETALISHLGYYKARELSCPGFACAGLWGVPLPGNVFCAVFGVEKRLDIIVGAPAVFAGAGRFDALIDHLRNHLDA